MICCAQNYVDAYYEKWKSEDMYYAIKICVLGFSKERSSPRDDIYYFDDQKIEDYIDFSETWYFELDDWEKFIVPFYFPVSRGR